MVSTHPRVSLALAVVLALTASAAASELGFVADVGVQARVSDWSATLPNPQWVAVPLTGCTTTTEWITVDQCASGYDHIVCQKTVCNVLDFQFGRIKQIITTGN